MEGDGERENIGKLKRKCREKVMVKEGADRGKGSSFKWPLSYSI